MVEYNSCFQPQCGLRIASDMSLYHCEPSFDPTDGTVMIVYTIRSRSLVLFCAVLCDKIMCTVLPGFACFPLHCWLGCSLPVSATAFRQHLHSAASRQLVVLSYQLSSYGRRTSVAGPTTWNLLPRHLYDPLHTTSAFGRLLETFRFSEYYHIQCIRGRSGIDALYKFMLFFLSYLFTWARFS